MKKLIFFSLLISFSLAAHSQLFTADSIRIVSTNPDSCTTIQIDVLTTVGCTNFTRGATAYRVNGSTINLEVNYMSSPICLGALVFPTFNFNLNNIPAGTYSLVATALLDKVFMNRVTSQNFVVASCSTVGLEEPASDDFEIYPNPATETIYIISPNEDFELRVLDIRGSLVENINLIPQGNKTLLDISEIHQGVYFLEIRKQNDLIIKKIIKQ